jgi:hypothetical protein
MSKVKVKEENGEFSLTCQGGNVTTRKTWTDEEKAEKTRKNELWRAKTKRKSALKWIYPE